MVFKPIQWNIGSCSLYIAPILSSSALLIIFAQLDLKCFSTFLLLRGKKTYTDYRNLRYVENRYEFFFMCIFSVWVRKDMSNCCQDTPILYGNTQLWMRCISPHQFGWGTRFRAQNEDFVHFWPPKTPFWVKKWPYLNHFSIYSIGMHVAPLFKAN